MKTPRTPVKPRVRASSKDEPERDFTQLPDALTTHVGYLLVTLGKRAQRAFSAALEPHGVRPAHFDVLACLDHGGPRSQADIARVLALEPAHLVALLDELQGLSLVLRGADPDDRRRYAITLTPQGTALMRRLARTAREVERALVADLDADEQTLLRTLLQRLARGATT